jgi:hypothetical protein
LLSTYLELKILSDKGKKDIVKINGFGLKPFNNFLIYLNKIERCEKKKKYCIRNGIFYFKEIQNIKNFFFFNFYNFS